jgi:pilus assembly protein CpaB
MNTGRIVELTVAVGAGGVAACSASGSDNKTGPVAQLRDGTVDAVGCAISSSVAQL